MSNPISYKFRTFQELVDVVPTDRIRDCMDELKIVLSSAKAGAEIAYEAAGVEPVGRIVEIPEELEWIDDGKGTIDLTMATSDGQEIGTLEYRKMDQ